MARKKKNPDEERVEALLDRARKNLKNAQDAEFKIRVERREDLKFLAGEQWPEDIRMSRQADKRPCLTINRLPQFLQMITNDARQNRPDISVDPVGSGADEETAEVFQGMIRHITYDSRGDTAGDTAFMYAVACGDGYFRVVPEYESEDSFDQVLKIKTIPDPDSVFIDPTSIEPDGSDASFGFIVDDLTPEEYEQQFPDSEVAQGLDLLTEYVTKAPDWFGGKNIRVAEYYEKTFEEKTLHLLKDGTSVFDDELKAKDKDKSVKTRKVQVPKWKWYKLNGVEILEETEWLCPWIPIVRVKGQELIVDGETHRWGIIRFARDVQRRYNYLRSAEAEVIALAPRVPFIVAEGQLDGYENDWAEANNRNFSYLKYIPVSNEGTPAPPPARQEFVANTQSLIASTMQASEELKSTTGIYDDALGAGEAEKSGRAIMARQSQSHSANFHFVDNYHKSLRFLGLILTSAIPNYYDTPRIAHILQEDGKYEQVHLNEPYAGQDGKVKHHDLSKGRYDVVIHAGPSYQTKRQETAAWLQEATRGNPALMSIIGPVLFRNMDLPQADLVADCLSAMAPPPVQAVLNKGKGGPEVPPEVQQKMQQMGGMIQQLSKVVHEQQNKLDAKTLEIESKERIADKQILMEAAQVLATLKSKEATALLQHEVGSITNQLQMLGQDQPIPVAGSGGPPSPATGAGSSGPAVAPPSSQPAANVPGNLMGNQ